MGNCNMNPTPLVQIGDYEFNPNDIIGTGYHGVLFQGSPRNDKLFEIAIKQINQDFDRDGLGKAKGFLSKLTAIEHKNIAQYIDFCYSDKDRRLYLIIEFCAHGTLYDLMQSQLKFSPLSSLKIALKYCQQIIRGLVALHKKEVLHQNLRPQNILIHYDNIKISDFGLLELEKLSTKGARKQKISIYRAPELMNENCELTEKCDIWSLGVILYQLVYKTRPVEIMSRTYVLADLQRGKNAVLDDLIKNCVCIDPQKRFSTEELKDHPFLIYDPENIREIETASSI